MAGSSRHSFLRTISVVAAAGVALLGSAPGAVAAEPPGVAAAAAAPLAPEAVPPTVTADALPTWQVNGVVWSQAIVGTTAYVTGSFTKARPPGVAAGGAGEVTAGNILAIDITTGNRVASFNHSLNAQGLVIRASADGTKLFVGGDFTAVDGQTRGHIASFDLPSGALNSFAPNINGQVRGLGITSTTVYAGGNFTSAAGASRTRLAAFQRANGSLTPWAPSATGGYVWSMVMSPDQTKVIAGGSFTTVNGQEAYGMASINADATTNPWPATANAQGRIRAAGANGAITSLKTDGTNVFGTSYAFGAGASFEGPFSINPNSGEIVWANDCLGDTYDITVMGSVAYNVSHQHDCSPIGSFPDTNPRVRWQKASATTAYPTGITERNDAYGWNFIGVPYAQVLHWFPNFAFGSITASGQAGWAVDGTADGRYLLVGGEFPRVNGVAQQGLVRFARSDIAPRKVGPSYATIPATPVPATTAVSLEAGTARVTWGTAWDYDDSTLTYELLRDNAVWVPQATRTIASNFWTLPRAGFVDTGLAVGSTHRYQVRITDSAGNQLWSPISNTVTIGAGAPSAYAAQVKQDGAAHLWRLGEPSGTSVMDWADFDDATLSGGYTRGASGATADGDSSTTFDGINGLAVNSVRIEGPQTFTVEAWFRTTTSSGGKIVGFGDQPTGNSSNYDRHIYMEPDGRVTFGVWNNGGYTVSSPGALNDGQWHHAVGTMEPGSGVTLYVDGKRIGRNPTSQAQPYSGYWRIGGDTPWSGNAYFAGDIDEVAVYPAVLTLDQVRSHWTASGRAVTWPTRPTDAYGAAVWDSGPEIYWRLGEAAGPAAVDSSPNGVNGQYQGSGHTFGQPGVLSGNTAVRFDGAEGTQVVSANQTPNPNPYSEELWFSTTTTVGGKLIGFGCSQTGRSGCYDRHVWMNNDGTLHFGAWTGAMNIASTTESFNDGQWHHLVATQGTDGMKLYVDGILRATNPQQAAEGYSGWWRLGGDNSWGGSSAYFNGVLDEAAIYPRVLTPAEIADHFAKGGGLLPNQLPTASFTTTTSPLTVAVDGSGSSDPDGTIVSYAWDFGDGATGTGAAATHSYAAAGTFTVTLTVTDNRNATASTTRSVTIAANLAPLASFTTTTSPLTVAVDGSASTDPDGTIASYAWDFGDGNTGTGATATHTYAAPGTFTVTLTVTDDLGATASSTQSVTIAANQAPTASFTTVQTNLSVSVDGSASTDPDGTIASYTWDFGDGSTGTGATATHTYAAAGTYTVTLTVTDAAGATATASESVTVTAPPNQSPSASFTFTQDLLQVSVNGSGSNDPDGTVTSYSWQWGDGSPSGSGATATHAYAAAGTYPITLTVTDNLGATGMTTQNVTVVANQTPSASFTATSTGLTASVNGTASADPDGTIEAYQWVWGDGTANGLGSTATHTYAAAGTYTVTLTVTDNRGATGTASQSVTVVAPTALAQDSFTRSVSSGWGTADVGGAWTTSGSGWSVSGGAGLLQVNAASGYTAALPSVSTTAAETAVTLSTNKTPTGSGHWLHVIGRRVSATADYRAKLRYASDGSVTVWLSRLQGGTDTTLASAPVPGLTYAPNDLVHVRLQVEGTSPTTMRVKVWKAGTPEPTAWLLTASDSTAGLQQSGHVALYFYLSSSATNSPVVFRADDLWVGAPRP